MSSFIGIDPGTSCGWAVLSAAGGRIGSGTWDCSTRRGEGAGFRFVRFERCLRELLGAHPGAQLAYEEVRRHAGTDAAHVYGGLRSHILRVCEELGVPYCPVPVGTVKKAATGKGNADKNAMVSAARARWGAPDRAKDDDEADALFIAECLRGGFA